MSAETMTLEEASEALRCQGILTVRQLLADGELPGIKPGKEWVIPRAAFWHAVNEMAVKEAHFRKQARAGQTAQVVQLPEKKKPGRPRQSSYRS